MNWTLISEKFSLIDGNTQQHRFPRQIELYLFGNKKMNFYINNLSMLCIYIFLGVDDAESECGLDEGVHWNFIIHNNGNQEQFDTDIKRVTDLIDMKIANVTL